MANKKSGSLALTSTRVTRTIYFLLVFMALSIIIFDSGNLITREAVIQRWTLVSVLLVVNTAVWYLSARKLSTKSQVPHSALITLLAATLLACAGFLTYWERGMASTSTIFYALPLLVIATLKNRHALIAFTTLAAGTYAFAAVKYFNDYFNEGYRIQLWGGLLLFGGIIFTLCWLIMILTGLRHDSK